VEELRAKLEALALVEEPTCPASRFVEGINADDESLGKLVSESMMNFGVSVAEIHRELTTHGYKISRESISKYRQQICRCNPHCSVMHGGTENG
tara:strand:+ start:6701 stop:6982 length:282 start_codon:yes stop_codon:yes gene_type:complete